MDDGRALPPDTIQFRRWSGGVEIALLKPPIALKSRGQLWGAVGGSIALLFLSSVPAIALSLFHQEAGFTVLFPLIGAAIGTVIIASAIRWDREAAVLEVRDGYLTLVRSSGDRKQWPVAEIASVQAIWAAGPWALKITPKQGDPYTAFKGRGRIEMDWVAGLLRAALAPPRPAAPAVRILPGGVCQVCGSAMEERIVLCAKCRTPHHEECWTFNGSCSTYACKEIRFTRSA